MSAADALVFRSATRWGSALACAVVLTASAPWGREAATLLAQQPLGSPTFEVASVKPVDESRQSQPGIDLRGLRAGKVSIAGFSLVQLVGMAHPHLMGWENRIVGGPQRLMSKRFDVAATFEPRALTRAVYGPLPDPLPLMLRALLNKRFKLAAHAESRNLPVYVLEPANRDRSLGPNLKKSTTECPSKPDNSTSGSAVARCELGGRVRPQRVIEGLGVPIPMLVGVLAGEPELADRMIFDETALEGRYDVKLDLGPFGDNISIFTAVKEQLGLQLTPQMRSVEILVIDHIEEPSPN